MSVQCEAEQLPDPLSNRIAVLERQVQQLIEQSVEKIYFKAAVAEVDAALAEVDGRLAVVEIAPEVHSRFKAMETSLRELGAHFVRYQKDFVSNLEKKFEVFEQQMHIHEDRIKVFTQEAKARTREQMTEELVSTSASIQPVGTNGNTKSNWDNWKDTSTRESWSTVASEESEKQGELEHLMCGAREDIDMIHKDLRAHIASTEKRLAALEIGHISHHKKIQGITAASEEFTFEAKFKPQQSQSNLSSASVKVPTGSTKHISLSEFDTMLQGLFSSASQCFQSSNLDQPKPEQTIPAQGSSGTWTPSPAPNANLHAYPRNSSVETAATIWEPSSSTNAKPQSGQSRTLSPTISQDVPSRFLPLSSKPNGARESSPRAVSSEARKTASLEPNWRQSSPPKQVPRMPSLDRLGRNSFGTSPKRTASNIVLSPCMGDKLGSSIKTVSFQQGGIHAAQGAATGRCQRLHSVRGAASPSTPAAQGAVTPSTPVAQKVRTSHLAIAAAYPSSSPDSDARPVRIAAPPPISGRVQV
mmetsp:Transcript_57781/g.108760  ORF Transcript_57781/g.108760 Transcript_57781/m.108760 type:complete len:529 (+) Transcript_57781:102-1688(+)